MFEITIKETVQVKRVIGREWKKIGTVEKKRDPQYWQNIPGERETFLSDEMGYTPETESTQTVEIVRLVQNVETLDMGEVIRAINKIKEA